MFVVFLRLNRYFYKFRVGNDDIGRKILDDLICKLRE